MGLLPPVVRIAQSAPPAPAGRRPECLGELASGGLLAGCRILAFQYPAPRPLVLGKHRPERAGGPPLSPPHRAGLPEASYRKPVRPTGLTHHDMIREQILGLG